VTQVLRRVVPAALLILALALPARAVSAAPGPSVAFGAYLPELASHPDRIETLAHAVGRSPVLVNTYAQWDYVPFDQELLEAIWQQGAVPMVTWEPLSYEGREFRLGAIQRGRFDPYIRESADAAREWGRPVFVRFAHEMNGDWYPWGRGVEGNNSYRYRAVWRRVVEIFRNQGADNVKWVWSPNVNTGGELPFRDLYPGDEWVDWVAIDGFNWALRGEWNSITDIVDNTYEELTRLTGRPLMIAETGSAEDGGDKAEWVSSALEHEIPGLPRVRAVVWFDAIFGDVGASDGGTLDARIDSSAESLRAFRSGIASPVYGLSRARLLATPVDYRPGSVAAPAPPEGGYGAPSFLYSVAQKLHGRYLVLAIACVAVGLAVVVLAAYVFKRRRLRRRRP
jgi:hypothetical protein